MKAKICVGVAAFIGAAFLMAGLLWVGGFDFDERNVFVAYFAAVAFVVSVAAGVLSAQLVEA